ncbi:MAG: HlyD family type I secretion periplasmic adaptor subunit [Pseudomonadota bacterium]
MSDAPALRTGMSAVGRAGLFGAVLLLSVSVTWAHTTRIAGAVIATGTVTIEGRPKQVQHFDGGVVDEILVREGATVRAGETLIILDRTLLEANLAIYKARLADLMSRRSRLQSEQIEAPDVAFAPLPEVIADLDVSDFRRGQREVFDARRALQDGKDAQLREKIVQFGNQIEGVEGLLASKREQLALIETELVAKVAMNEKGLIVASEVSAIRRSKADLEGQVAEHISDLARIANSIQDAKIEILLNERQFKEQVVAELQDISTQIGELTQQILSTQKQLDRVALRAPVDGIVHEMQVFTEGGVVPPGGTVLQIVPQNDLLSFEVRVDPVSIDQVYLGQEARIRFSAFNQRTTPEVIGHVLRVSPTSVVDEVSGLSFFTVQVDIEATEIEKLGDVGLVPGMPVDAFLQTDERTVLSYFVKPLTDQVQRAFREE